MLIALSIKTSKHLIEIGFLAGAIGAGIHMLAALGQPRAVATSRWLAFFGSAAMAGAFVLAVIAFHWGHF